MKLHFTKRTLETLEPPREGFQRVVWDTELPGFGAVVGRRGITFVANFRANGKLRRMKIGQLGAPRPAGGSWTLADARRRALEILGQVAGGEDPSAGKRARQDTLTLQEGIDLHVADMRKRKCSEDSIETYTDEIGRYMQAWLDRPLTDLTALELHHIHSKMEEIPYAANRLIAAISAIWNTVDELHELPGRNPASKVTLYTLEPSRKRLEDDELPGWYARVQTLSPIRRDLQLVCLFTGLRSEDARFIRWNDINFEKGSLYRPDPKGGTKKAFQLPLPPTVVEIFKQRQIENAVLFAAYGGDHEWVFPSLSRRSKSKARQVQPVAEPKERRTKDGKRSRRSSELEQYLPGLHTLRRTYINIGNEIGIAEIDMHALANHSFSKRKVQDQYIRQAFQHLAECQARIEVALWTRISFLFTPSTSP
jgi:integrase